MIKIATWVIGHVMTCLIVATVAHFADLFFIIATRRNKT